jgi:hypothetical protein
LIFLFFEKPSAKSLILDRKNLEKGFHWYFSFGISCIAGQRKLEK